MPVKKKMTKTKKRTTKLISRPESEAFIETMVFAKEPGEDGWKGRGTHEFRVLPRIGEVIGIDVEEANDLIGYAYEVVAVHHPDTIQACAADIYVVRRGMIIDELDKLFRSVEDNGTSR